MGTSCRPASHPFCRFGPVILLTVGTQLGFDRLIEAIDAIAPALGMRIVAQTGKGQYVPLNLEHRADFEPSEFRELVEDAELIVSHAGIGTVLAAGRARKPIVIMPRRAALSEHRNDHQLATARHLGSREGIVVAMDADELAPAIKTGLGMKQGPALGGPAAELLMRNVDNFIRSGALLTDASARNEPAENGPAKGGSS